MTNEETRMGPAPIPAEQRFWSNVEKTNGCWEWQGRHDKDGYGTLCLRRGKNHYTVIRAHRLSYMLHSGDIPEGLCVCHACDNRGCVNPEHLWLGTNQQNTRDKVEKGRQPHVELYHKKLCAVDVRLLYELRAQGWLQREIGVKLGITQPTVSYWLKREVYHL